MAWVAVDKDNLIISTCSNCGKYLKHSKVFLDVDTGAYLCEECVEEKIRKSIGDL